MGEWWNSLFQTAIDAYYAGNLSAGLDACERLLSVTSLPPRIDLQTRRNLVFYTPTLRELGILRDARQIVFPVPDGWSLLNPSIAADPGHGRLRMIVRSANYAVTPYLQYTVNDQDGVFRTTNYFLDLTSDLEMLDVRAIDDRAVRLEPPPFLVAGFEDGRLFHHRDHWWMAATVRDRNQRGICQIALLPLDGAAAREPFLLSDATSERHEKNWMPVLSSDGILRFVYSCFPTTILRYDDELETVAPENIMPAPVIARRFSGGTQVIPCDGGHLCLVHEGVDFEDHSRVYLHRWVWFDAGWRLAKLSSPFFLHERGIEFAAGLAQRGEELIISYGLWDREAWLATVPLESVLSLLAAPLDAESIEAEAKTQPAAPPMTRLGATTPEAGITPFPNAGPTIVSTTLTGNNREIIGDALRSVVDWVDWCLLIDTGASDDTLEIAREIAGDKLVVREHPWQNDFAAARNFALAAAADLGADWAVTLDTDERIDLGGVDVRAILTDTSATSFHVKQFNGTYGKERVFRLPARGRYVGPTHEAFIADGGSSQTLEGVRFSELGKTPEQYRQKAERDIAILTRHTAEHPDDPRWFYYLADSYAGLGQFGQAIAAFHACASLRGWDEEGAWAMYRAAECQLKLDRPAEAVEDCAAGMARHAGLAELPWLASYASWHAGRAAQAVYWARLAVAMGHFTGAGAAVPRIGFRHPPALWEGPYDVLRFALRAQGDDAGADEAERLFELATSARETSLDPGVPAAGRRLTSPRRSTQAPALWDDVLVAPAFIINLDRNPERLVASRQSLADGGFTRIERFRAVDGSETLALERAWDSFGSPRFDPADSEFAASPGRQGCFLSHLGIWRQMVAEDIPFASVFEDDLLLHENWRVLAPLFYAATPKDFDLLLMGARIVDPTGEAIQVRPTFNLNGYLITKHGAAMLSDLVLSQVAGVATLDVMLSAVQQRSLEQPGENRELTWYVWNGAGFPDPRAHEAPWFADRNMGLVFQDWTRGSEIDGWQGR